MSIPNKWKRFSIEQMTSSFDSNITAERLFDKIVYSNDDALPAIFEEHEVCIWGPFEDMGEDEFAYKIEELARAATECETGVAP